MTVDAPAPSAPRAARLWEWLDARVNPMLLKDLRLWMRARKFLVMYFLVLAGSVFAASMYAVLARADHFDGRGMWGILCGTLAFAAWAVVPYFVFERFQSELGNRATELVLLSALTPAKLVLGKLASAWCASLLCAAAITPMLVTAYLLGGIDFQVTLFSLAVLALGAAVMPMLQLYIATLGKRAHALRGMALLAMAWQASLGIVGAAVLYGGIRRGTVFTGAVWWVFLAFAVALALFGHFLFRLTVARLTSPHANRDAAPRLALVLFMYGGALAAALACWRLAALGPGGVSLRTRDWAFLAGGFGLSLMGALVVGVTMLTATAETISRRLRGLWTDRPLRRLFLFPGIRRLAAFFFANAVFIFCLLGLSSLLFHWDGSSISSGVSFLWSGTGLFTAVAAGLVAHLYVVVPLWRKSEPPAAALTILIVNCLLGLLATGFNVLYHANLVGRDLFSVVLSFCPPVVFAMGLDRDPGASELTTRYIGGGFAVTLAVMLFLTVLDLPRIPPPAPAADAPDAPPGETP